MPKKPQSEIVIHIENLSKIYPFGETEVRALDGVSFDIHYGEFIGIMGPSGSGKSTLLNLIGALDTPTEGEYLLDNVPVNRNSNLAEIRRQKIGFVFQTFNLLPALNATQNVELPMVYLGISAKQRHQHAKQLLKRVGLENRLEHKPSQLSGGQRQRVAIARALANDPKIILADEPTGNLDSKSGHEVMKLLNELNAKGTTLIMVTHEEYLAEQTDRTFRLMDGKIV